MSLIDTIPANGQSAGATPAPVRAASPGGLMANVPTNGQQPKAASMHELVPTSPNMQPPGNKFFSAPPGNPGFTPSTEKDSSGLPYLAYKPPQVSTPSLLESASAGSPDFSKFTQKPGLAPRSNASPSEDGTITDYTRVATTFDPRSAAPIITGSFTTPRAVANRAALKTAMGGAYSDQLDHVISLELAGSNDKGNLQIEPLAPGKTSTATDPIENQLAKDVISGKTSLFQAQWDLAKEKGAPLPYLGDAVNKYEEQAYTAKSAATYANSPIGLAENAIGTIGNWALSLGTTVLDHMRAAVSSPSGALGAAQGAVQTAIVKPAAFVEGIGSAILHKEDAVISGLFGNQPQFSAPTGPFTQLAKMNSAIPRSPDEQKAFDTGSFLGWMVPYSGISRGVQAAADATHLGTLAPKIAPLIPYISDAAGFLGTGQILHDPATGTRMQQLKNDTIALALFDVGGFVLKSGGVMAMEGLRKILPDAAAEDATRAMKPLAATLEKGEQVSADQLEAATSRANAIIQDATGKYPQELLQDHFGLSPAPVIQESNKYPTIHEGGKIKMVEGEPVKIVDGINTFVHKGDDGWVVSEASTGRFLSESRSKEGAIAKAHFTIDQAGEDHFIKMIEENKLPGIPTTAEEAATRYWDEKLAPELEAGKATVIGADDLKDHFSGDYADANHATYSKAAFSLYDKALHENSDPEVALLGGGPGSGKTELITKDIVDNGFKGIVYDSNLANYEGAVKQIEAARAAGKKPEIFGVIPNLENAHGFTLARAQETGRAVSDESFANGHGGFPQVVRQLIENKIIPAEDVHLLDTRAHTSLEETLSTVEKEGYAQDPLALLNDLGYSKEDVKSIAQTNREAFEKQKVRQEGGRPFADHQTDQGQEGQNEKIPTVVDLPELPAGALTLHGVAFPGANTIGKFIQKDIVDKFGSVTEAMKGIYEATKDLFSYNKTRAEAASIVGSNIQKMEQYSSSAWHVAEERRTWWAQAPENVHLKFLNAVETGDKSFNDFPKAMQKTLLDLSDEYANRLNVVFKKEAAAGLDKNYIENYFPHMWTEPEKAAQVFQDYFFNAFGANYREAFGSFQGSRTIDLIGTGINAGLQLVTTNPEELVIMREIDGFRAITKNSMMYELNKAGLAVPLKNMFMDKGMPTVKGVDGRWWGVVPEAKQILDNAFFAPNLWSDPGIKGKIFRSFMAVKGTVVPLQLSLSGFHPFHVQTIASASALSQAMLEVLNGNMSAEKAMLEMGKGLSMANTVSDLKNYWNVNKWWATPIDKLEGEAKTTVQWLIDAGGSPGISEEFKIRAADGFKGALRDENYIGAAIRGVPKLVEAMQKPIFEYYVPALKIGAFMQATKDAVAANPELLTDDLARKVAFRAIWSDMDSRFGEMVYKTKFWNPMMTQIGEASFLSLGWQVGFVDQFGGGALDVVKLAAKGLTGKATKADVTSRMVFSLVYSLQSAMWGGLMTYAMTGKPPASIQDLFYPLTGATNPDGSPARLNTPFYTREFFALQNHIKKEGLVGGPLSMIKNKANPILNSLAAIYQNQDFYGYEIRGASSPIAEQAAQLFQYVVENNFLPISIKGAQQAMPVTGKTGVALSIAGFNPAPKYISESEMQTKIYAVLNERTGGTKSLESKPAADAKQNIRKLYQGGDIDGANQALSDAVDAGYIKPAGKTAFINALDLPGDVRAFKSLAQFPSDQEALLKEMSEEDLARYANYATKDLKSRLSTLSPTTKTFVDKLKAGAVHLEEFKAGKPISP